MLTEKEIPFLAIKAQLHFGGITEIKNEGSHCLEIQEEAAPGVISYLVRKSINQGGGVIAVVGDSAQITPILEDLAQRFQQKPRLLVMRLGHNSSHISKRNMYQAISGLREQIINKRIPTHHPRIEISKKLPVLNLIQFAQEINDTSKHTPLLTTITGLELPQIELSNQEIQDALANDTHPFRIMTDHFGNVIKNQTWLVGIDKIPEETYIPSEFAKHPALSLSVKVKVIKSP